MKKVNKAGKTETKSQIRHPGLKSPHWKRSIPFTILFIMATLVPDLIIASVTAAQPDKSVNVHHASGKQKVLVLHSYHDNGWTRAIQEGIESVFDKSGIAVEMHIEYMDTLRHPPEDSFAYLEDLYRNKYGHMSFDVILLSDNYALEFILLRRDRLFPEVPIVFCGINDFREEQLHGQSGITGVNEDIDIKGTIELASRIMPNINKFLVISDRTPTGLASRRKFEQTLSGLSNKEPAFELLDDLTTADIQKHLGKLSLDTAVLLFTFQRDKDGQLFTRPEYHRLIVESCDVPVFTFWEQEALRHGVMGGVMVSGATQGERSAEYALRILKGEPASSLPFIMKSPNVPILNYPLLRKFDIPKGIVPAEVIIRGEVITFYYRYKTTIWIISFLIISLAFVNMLLLINIARRKRAEEALQANRIQLSTALEMAYFGHWEYDVAKDIFTFNDQFYKVFRTTVEQIGAYTMHAEEYAHRFVHPDDTAVVGEGTRQAIETTDPHFNRQIEHRMLYADGTVGYISVRFFIVKDSNGRTVKTYGVNQDITDRKRAENEMRENLDRAERSRRALLSALEDQKRAEEEKAKLEVQLWQAQKMESVGRLAGGVAHDFNNMLGIILGYAEMAMDQVGSGHPVFFDLKEIRKAAERSADLTRQLLAFARKQTVTPRVLDLNETVDSMLKMIKRLIGEDIDLTWLPGENLWPVEIDPSQIDQILANLCINARDAITGVGRVTIETGATAFDEDYCAEHAGTVPGEYVLLAVSDDGCGMNRETLDKLFEPFFTTKEIGKGTGLGLATIYGIVKQNNGFINVYSEPGHGTTFKIYLPRYLGEDGHALTEGKEEPALRGKETILLVEDEPAILKMAKKMLETQGYTVLTASTLDEATRLAREHTDEISLLITDVVMPEMNGRDLAKNLLFVCPNLKTLFMSGYTADIIAHQGVLDEGVYFIEKPFSMREIAAKVREVLDKKAA